ncbi:class I SAM-dependent methyltransferase [Pseudomonas sp. ZM23]|uniref:Class I SAM-dependent methyltransferase n=1 Tax=Pseudomonas triclosanedens TaxID=2961893 RepID=A0ABY6ZZF0_9PSED|nr:class I SAM-dependent methyltransferase [Pseudomonas triclosanedens]MCP8463083.1 class I SAM-dependent methyltransferase [Pseudomonas triclosanedens]MCP8468703.1 class I SAM-dependent methyltransferase [Pseudomonas triclosanedens]MCP8475425.1 class I SAM-dependent methyltransferase [Pseudomonas triclosanedens]WAI50256.1 class I SAM-dependent methyltransferase [Pseudomonas triclosanedens]
MLVWDDHRFTIRSHVFQTIRGLSDLFFLKEADGYILGKPRRYIDKYVEHLATQRQRNIFELGIFRGGSTVFLNEFFQPAHLVAIDFMEKPAAQLDRYIAEHGAGRVKAFYGVNQADSGRLNAICDAEFAGEPLDLVVDDASHFLSETRISFNTLFPRLKAGGSYVIEDWAWAHQAVEVEGLKKPFAGKESLANLVIEILLASVSHPQLIDEVVVNDGFIIVRKGEAATPESFDIGQMGYLLARQVGGGDYFARFQ